MRGGHGPTLVLVHGYPQTWYEWRGIMPELAKHYTVIAPDLRGAGRSDAPVDGYDKGLYDFPALIAKGPGASGSLGDKVAGQVRHYSTDVTGLVVANSGHWIYEEHPAELTNDLLTFLR